MGLEDGSLLLLNAEDGEVAHRARLTPGAALVAISWTEAAAGGGGSSTAQQPAAPASAHLGGDRARRMFAPPPPPVPPPSAGMAVGYAALGRGAASSAAWPPEPARLAVLACASAAGDLALRTSGLFPLASASLPALLGAPEVRVLRLATAPSLRELSVAWREGGAGAAGPLRLSTLSLERLGAHAPQLHRLALAAAHVHGLLDGCRASWQAACKEWGGGQRELEESRARLVSWGEWCDAARCECLRPPGRPPWNSPATRASRTFTPPPAGRADGGLRRAGRRPRGRAAPPAGHGRGGRRAAAVPDGQPGWVGGWGPGGCGAGVWGGADGCEHLRQPRGSGRCYHGDSAHPATSCRCQHRPVPQPLRCPVTPARNATPAACHASPPAGEPGLKRLARGVDAAVCATHALLADHLAPQLEQLAFRLGELRGLALCLPWRRVTGLRPDQARPTAQAPSAASLAGRWCTIGMLVLACNQGLLTPLPHRLPHPPPTATPTHLLAHAQVGAAEQAALRLLMLTEALRARLVAAGAQHRTFFAWLLVVLRRCGGLEIDAHRSLDWPTARGATAFRVLNN